LLMAADMAWIIAPNQRLVVIETPPESFRRNRRMDPPAIDPTVAVGTVVSDRPPHRSVRAEFPHTAPTAGA